eukprot:TRINITY_DN824_c0_g1_i1.p1 TRINITY_DN824_c0_g1~~TRINITY_DN824_c0_g1_i1.p1  ORF type:complete len:132 (+),score=13.86 TRINITY_DN824_c0_g1_i1:314-709(+)
MLRHEMLRQFISTDGLVTLGELREAVRATRGRSVLRAPSWYKVSTVQCGPRRIGLEDCANVECYRCETEESRKFKVCANCHVPRYCSRECQMADWKFRHKLVCSDAKKEREQTKRVGELMQKMHANIDAHR